MKKSAHYIAVRIVIPALILLSISPTIHAQDPGFFLDEWQGKFAELPEYITVDKPQNPATVNITVDMSKKLYKVPDYIYGNNAVTWGGNMNEHATIMTDINNLNPHVLRWPGGSLSDTYFWNLSSSQRPDDIPSDQNVIYGVHDNNWEQSTDDYYDLLANTNSTGSIIVNYGYARYGTGPDPVAKAAHLAAEWVRYDNGRSKFWEIGNENFGSWEAGYEIDVSQNKDGQPQFISGQLYGQHCRVFIDSMRAAAAETGAEIKIGVVAYDAENSHGSIQTVWNEGMMPEVGDIADFLIVHQYFTPYDEDSPVSTILNSHHVPNDIMTVLVADMAEARMPMIPVGFTEWNIFAVGSMQQVSYINGMHSALVLGEFVKNNYGMAMRWDLTNGWSNGDDHGMFSRGNEPGVDYYNPRPVFFYMYYFQKYFGDWMVSTSVTGNSNVITYSSSFASGEAGMVIINKSTKDEIVSAELDNFTPGMKYYYHTLTGGDDNGDFSRKVFLNGYGTDEEGGGPDEYEDIKALSSDTDGGIKVNLPPLSVVYLMVDKKPPTYLFSKIDTNAAVITVEFTDSVLLSENPDGFEVYANDSDTLTISGIGADSVNTTLVYIFLDQEVLPSDEISLSYIGHDILSPDSGEVAPFLDVTVENLLPGATPRLRDAYTTPEGDTIKIIFNMEMEISDSSAGPFTVKDGNDTDTIALSAQIIDEGNHKSILIIPAEPLYAEYELVLSYFGTSVLSADSALLEPFDSLPITNHAPGKSPELITAGVSHYGFAVSAFFDKIMNEPPESDTVFKVKVNNEIFSIDNIHLDDNILIIWLSDYIVYDDTVTLSYEGSMITSLDGGRLQPFEEYQVINSGAKPILFDIPGMLDGELFAINKGMVLEPCSDTGGGYNLTDIDPGDWFEYEVNIAQTGIYTADIRVAAPFSEGILYIQTHDDEIVDHATAIIRVTGDWQTWNTITAELPLYEGRHMLRLTAGTANYNLNWVNFQYIKPLNGNALSASTNETGNVIEITFDRELAEPEIGDIMDFSVYANGNTVTVAQIGLKYFEKNILWFRLADTLAADDDNITVSYEPGMIVSLADNIPVSAFSNMQVTNNVIMDVESLTGSGVSVYPNPATDRINIESDGANITAVEILDVTGKRVLYNKLKSPQQKVKLDLEVPPGVYLVKIRSGNKTGNSKLIVY